MRSSSHRRAARLVLPAVVLLALSCCARHGQGPELRIGFIVPLTGPYGPLGDSHLEGAQLAVDDVDSVGGLVLKGRRCKVTLVVKDSSNTPERAVAAAQELISRDNVSAIVGPIMSSQAIPVAHLADRAGVPIVVQIATNPDVTRGTRTVFRVCATDDFQGRAMARFAFGRLGVRRVALLFDVASAYNSGIARIFAQETSSLGGRVVAEETYTTGARDFRTQLARIKAARPDALFLPNYSVEILTQVTQMQEVGLKVPILGADAMSFTEPRYDAAIEGAWYCVHFSPDRPGDQAVEFMTRYQKRYSHAPNQAGALSYDAVSLLFDAARARGSVEARDIADGLRSIGRFDGVTGAMSFEGSPDPRKGVVVVRMEKGSPRFEARVDP